MTNKVSIVVCTFNGEKYLREQLDSLLAQTYPLYEILVQDDGSTDGTRDIVQEYVEKYPSLFRFEKHEHPKGWNQNFLDAISKAKGDYIAPCDQDDIWAPDKIEKQISQIGDNWLHACSSSIWNGKEATPFYSDAHSLLEVAFCYPYAGHQLLISKEMLPYVNIGLNVDISHDRFFPSVAIYKGKMTTSHDLSVKWRRHNDAATVSACNDIKTSGVAKFWKCVVALAKKQKSSIITRACNKYVMVYSALYEEDNSYSNSQVHIRLMKRLRDQTITSYFGAGCDFYILRKEMWPGLSGIKLIYTAFTYPFRWWYIHKDNV